MCNLPTAESDRISEKCKEGSVPKSASICVNPRLKFFDNSMTHAVASPGVILGDGYKIQTVYDEYSTTLKYQPGSPNSIPVSIISFWWYWTGVSTRMGYQ